ncbi:MAG TPA: DUF1549 and DUF1553 domain-containing protein, partial [Chthoniobacteraceae bacterium]
PHWAYAPVVRPPLPGVDAATNAQGEAKPEAAASPVDAFIRARLTEKKISPAPVADSATLIRRLSLDLTGLPPTPDEVAAFVREAKEESEKKSAPVEGIQSSSEYPEAAASSSAYNRLVDRLLASPRYGERMAQQWLDLARYADSVGFHGDQGQPVWAYRDWVIDAYNSNMPFDQFTTEQLAGDLLPNPTPSQLIATCFNRLNMVTREGGAQTKEYLIKYTADRTRTVGTTWLGSTVGCAECHDHKFDPWSQKDVYSLGAFFADVKQWGVYHDYGSSPNPDLAGWSNDHPFPPELIVESAALKRRIEAAKAQIGEAVRSKEAPPEKFVEWQSGTMKFLEQHASGWETPKAALTVKAAQPEAKQEADGRVIMEVKPTREIQADLQPSASWLAALKIELLPNSKHGNRVLRVEGNDWLRPEFELVRDGKSTPIHIRLAQADRSAPRYFNGFERTGVQDEWKIAGNEANAAHTAVYFPAQPVALQPGDTVRVRIPENRVGSLRVSTSPLAPLDVQQPTFPENLASLISDPGTAREYHLRATAWNADAFAKVAKLDANLLEYRGGKTPVLVTQQTDKPLTVRVLPRGNWQDETGEVVPAATPHFLPKLAGVEGRQLNRLDLAKWLVAPENPLPARVVMNRLWRQFFGVGLSAQLDDLGAQGEPPSHPELLDWLAAEFRESGWNTKHMVKLLVTSDTYRQAAGLRPEVQEFDPQNRLLAAQNPRRLDAEFVRDNALAISGLLNGEIGGPAAKPYQPAKYYGDLQFPEREYQPDADESQYRRGLYMWWQRTQLHPMLINFDAPSREDCIALRTSANTPQQALTLLNDPTFVEAARVWAGRLLAIQGDDAQRIELAFQQALSRAPLPEEKEALLGTLNKARSEFKAGSSDGAKLLKIGLAPAAQGDPNDLGAWTTVCRVILNLHETITRY